MFYDSWGARLSQKQKENEAELIRVQEELREMEAGEEKCHDCMLKGNCTGYHTIRALTCRNKIAISIPPQSYLEMIQTIDKMREKVEETERKMEIKKEILKNTPCKNCIHERVCKYKDDLVAAVLNQEEMKDKPFTNSIRCNEFDAKELKVIVKNLEDDHR